MEEIRPILKKAKQSITKIQQRHRSSKSCGEKIEKELAKIGKNMEWTIKNIDKTGQDAVQKSIKLLKGQIEQRNHDILGAKECKKQQLKNYRLYHKALKSVEELRSGEIDQCVGSIYCDGHDWLTESIARWEEQNKKAEGEIRKLEWQLRSQSPSDNSEGFLDL